MAAAAAAATTTTSAASSVSSSFSARVSYTQLCTLLRDISALSGVRGLIEWDELVMMPSGSSIARGNQKAALSATIHDKLTAPRISELLLMLKREDSSSLSEFSLHEQANIRLTSRMCKEALCIPESLVRDQELLSSRAHATWITAREKKSWNIFEPVLEEWVNLCKKRAQLINPEASCYDTLLDHYSPGMTSKRLDEVFSIVKAGLVPFLADLRARGTPPSTALTVKKVDDDTVFNVEQQASMCKEIAVALGFDLKCGRLDVSVHPFTQSSHPSDVRMTTRFNARDLSEGLTGAIHETGHSLYEQGRNISPEFDGLPVNEANDLAVHESQSLFWERMVGLSKPFSEFLLPRLLASFPELKNIDGAVTVEALYGALNVVRERSMIRVEADEVTYPMHVIIRYEIERSLIDGSLSAADVPTTWANKMEEYLGVRPINDLEGALQDVHWSAGLFGYFPTYLLGSMIAAQLHVAMSPPELCIKEGKFDDTLKWLRENVHCVGSLHTSADGLLKAATGSSLDPDVFLGYIKKKYSDLYKLN